MLPRLRDGAIAILLGLSLLRSQPADAEGALAVGLPQDVATQGFAFGAGWNWKSSDQAQAQALANCRNSPNTPDATRALCRVVRKFDRQCFAFAMDRDLGTPGVGWSVSVDRESAERAAMMACEDTAGESRRQYCQIGLSQCDVVQ
jgi:hypothetical protein